MSRKSFSLTKIVIGLIILLSPLYLYWYYDYEIHTPINPPGSSPTADNPVILQINHGETIKTTARHLKEKNLIGSETAFYLYARLNDLDKKLIAGRFILNRTLTTPEILTIITNPARGNQVMTIIEGETSKNIDEKLTDAGLIEKSQFMEALKNFSDPNLLSFVDQNTIKNLPVPMEGYLFPDSYFINPSTFNSDDFIATLIQTFKNKALKVIETAESERSLEEIMTMASIIEHEASGANDAPVISGILWKRADNGWFLGADATSLYLKDTREITPKILKEESPYNTRNFQKGLPPGPIGNPGLNSIRAALNPEETDYWYYLHSPDGQTHYAETNEEHNRNREKYL